MPGAQLCMAGTKITPIYLGGNTLGLIVTKEVSQNFNPGLKLHPQTLYWTIHKGMGFPGICCLHRLLEARCPGQ